MARHIRQLCILAGVLAIASTAPAAQPQRLTHFIDHDGRFADYPCQDARGYPAKCDVEVEEGVYTSGGGCIDLRRRPVKCMDPVMEQPPPPPPPLDASGRPVAQPTLVSKDPRRIDIWIETEDFRPRPPLKYTDPTTGIVVDVRADRRRVSATDATGKRLWLRDPLEDSKTGPYRSATPRINQVWASDQFDDICKRAKSHCVGVSYDSTQYGLINLKNGEFYFLGQN